LSPVNKAWPAAATAVAIASFLGTSPVLHAQSLHVTTNRVFATDVTTDAPAVVPAGAAAAVVDGHVIPMRDVIAACLRADRADIVDQMVQDYVVDRECAKQGIVVSDADIDNAVDELRKNLAPMTLEQVIAQHHSSMEYVRNAFKEKFERVRLVQDQVQHIKIVHCRAIVIKYALPGEPQSVAGATRSKDEAKALIKVIQGQLGAGKDFGDLANQYSDAAPKTDKGDIGMLYSGAKNEAPQTVEAALSLVKGELFPSSFEVNNAIWLMQAISTNDDHSQDEEGAYQDAFNAYREQQAQFLYPQFVANLIQKSNRAYVLDADAIEESGKPLPDSAGVIDGHEIPMKDVVAQCMTDDGPQSVDTLVQNYLVDRECKRRKINVSDAQIDELVQNLANQIKPHTLEEGLKYREITMDQLRYDFKQQIERSDLVVDQVRPTKIVHCRVITIKYGDDAKRTEAEALALIEKIQGQIKQGGDFGSLGAQDIGMLWQGINNVETPLLDAGLALDKGSVTSSPVKLINAYCLVQTISTSSNHPKSEDQAYASALAHYKDQRTPMLEPDEIIKLIKSSKVTYYIHA